MNEELSLKQRRFIKAYIQTGNATQAAKVAGYKCKTKEAYAEMDSQIVRKVEGRICEIMIEIGLEDTALAQEALREGRLIFLLTEAFVWVKNGPGNALLMAGK